MPLRSDVLVKQWSTGNLPILPFLAPRVFQSWTPQTPRRRKAHNASNARQDTNGYMSQALDKGSRGIDGYGCPAKDVLISTQDVGSQSAMSAADVSTTTLSNCQHEDVGVQSVENSEALNTHILRRNGVFNQPSTVRGKDGRPSKRFTNRHDRYSGSHTHPMKRQAFTSFNTTRRVHTITQPSMLDFSSQDTESIPDGSMRLHKDQDKAVRIFQDMLETEDELALRRHWVKISETIRSDSWPNLVLETLRNRPQHVRKFLAVTKSDKTISKCLEDLIDLFFSPDLEIASAQDATQTLDDLGAMWTENMARPADITLKDIYTVVFELLRSKQWNRIELSQRSIYMMLSYLTDSQLLTFFKDLTNLDHPLKFHTLLQFGSRLAKKDENGIEVAVQILRTFAERRLDFGQPSIMSLCTTILHGFHQLSETGAVASKFQELLGIGMKVNVITYNVLILNAVQHGEWETAWRIHDMMVEGRTMPDAYTYSILLNDAKLRYDVSTIEKVMSLVIQNGFQEDPYIVTDLLHYTLLLSYQQYEAQARVAAHRPLHEFGVAAHHAVEPEQTARKMLDKYAQHFLLGPLRKLVPAISANPSALETSSKNKLAEPGLPTIHVMLSGLLWNLNSAQTRAIYDNFIRLINERDQLGLKLAKSDFIWAIFLKALGKHHDQLSECPRLVKKMISLRAELTAERKAKEAEARALGKPITLSQDAPIPEPNVHVWSILVDILTKNKQMRAAEKIFTAMESRGVKPNEVTWTTLAWGYSRAQEAGKVADTIHRMGMSGVEIVDPAKASMLQIKDRQGLRSALGKLKRLQEGNGRIVSSADVHSTGV